MKDKQVLKFPLTGADGMISMPAGAEVLRVEEQFGTPTLWAVCDALPQKYEPRSFVVVGTGMVFDGGGLVYVGTTVGASRMVWHVFERVQQP